MNDLSEVIAKDLARLVFERPASSGRPSSRRRTASSMIWKGAHRHETRGAFGCDSYDRRRSSTAGAAAADRTRAPATGRGRESGPAANVTLYVPAKATLPVPLVLHLMFGPRPSSEPARPMETGPLADILSRGYGYAHFRYTEVQPDARDSGGSGVIALALAPGQTKPEPDEWGSITAWAWAASRVLDYLETDRAVDARRVALLGHSRLGKTALWAGSLDPRFALDFASCSGEMGASLARRDYGEDRK